MKRLTRNAARCLLCNTVIESRSRHDLQCCHCLALCVDGGLDYVKRIQRDATARDIHDVEYMRRHVEDLSECTDLDGVAVPCGGVLAPVGGVAADNGLEGLDD